jgi:hypothetical protein
MKETGVEFHAKNDSGIVKHEVFRLLQNLDVSVQAVVRRKEPILEQAVKTYRMTGAKRTINEKEIYHDMIIRLFRNLPDNRDCRIVFSERGKTFSDQSLAAALRQARRRDSNETAAKTVICKMPSRESAGLQMIDYFLWTILQIYEHNNIDYFNLLRDKYKLIIDMDDTRNGIHGAFYNEKNEITIEKIN